MTNHSFLIGPVIKDGLRKDVKPHAIPEDAWKVLTNGFQYRGRVVRRYGYTSITPGQETTRLSTDGGTTFLGLPVMGLKTQQLFQLGQSNLIGFDTVNAYSYNGTNFTTLASVMPVTWSGTNSQFFWTTNYAGAFWATNSKSGFHGWALNTAGVAFTAASATNVTVDAPGNTVAIGDKIYFLNVTGIASANNLIFATVTVAGNPFTVGSPIFPAGISTFVNGSVTGGMVLDSTKSITGQDGIRYYAATGIGNTWVNYNPPIDPNNALMGALLIFPYRGYLVFLNTTEGGSAGTAQEFPNRARWTQLGTPYYTGPVPTTPSSQTSDPLAARDDIFGRGGATDAPTNDIIVSAGFIRDILVVYFQKSTWRLRFVNNAQNPFVWERINVELGSSCTFSSIAFDKGLMSIGTRGIIISDGNDTIRFDEKIPDDVFDIRQDNNGFPRVQGIRTFNSKLCYWTYPDVNNPAGTFPDKVLVYNYETHNWSYFDDCFTCFGYNYGNTVGFTWNDLTKNWSSYNNITWSSGSTAQGYETIIAGNQQGFVFALEQTSAQNSPSLSISAFAGNTITSNDHNLKDGDWIKLTNISGITYSDGVSLNNRNFKISYINSNQFSLNEFESITAGNASGAIFTFTIGYLPIVSGSVQINVGALVFTDPNLDGILVSSGSNSGTIDYETGELELDFSPSIGSTAVNIRIVSYSPSQLIDIIATTGAYTPGGLITKISNVDWQSKVFNFFQDDKKAKLSYIDFYTNLSQFGQFTCNVLGDTSNYVVNTPLPDNLQSNIVMTSNNPFQPTWPQQVPGGDQFIFRLYCDTLTRVLQLQLTFSDQQMAVDTLNSSSLEVLSMIINMRKAGRLA